MHGKHVRLLLLHKLSKKSILGRCFDALFWHYFVLIFFLHRCTQMISIDILVPICKQLLNNGGKWQEFTSCRRVYKMQYFFAIYSNRRQLYIITFRRQVWLSSSPFRPVSISIFIPEAVTGATRINTNCPEIDN